MDALGEQQFINVVATQYRNECGLAALALRQPSIGPAFWNMDAHGWTWMNMECFQLLTLTRSVPKAKVVQAGMIIVLAAVYPVMMIAMMLVCSWHLGVGSYPAPVSLGGVEGNRGPAALQRAIWQLAVWTGAIQTSNIFTPIKHFRSQLCRLQFQCQREVVVM